MHKKTDLANRLRVASPCPTSWESMRGDNRVRFCELCQLNVYDISELTGKQTAELIASKEGRLCARLHRRADGTVITKDCPVGLRAIRRRVSRIAGATITAVLSFCFGVMGQHRPQDDKSRAPGTTDKTKTTKNEQGQDIVARFAGVVIDPNGAVVAGAAVTLIHQETGKTFETTTNDEGTYTAPLTQAGAYTVRVEAAGFETKIIKDVMAIEGITMAADVMIGGAPTEITVTVGFIIGDETMDYASSNLRTTFSPKKITSLPF